MFSKFLRLEIKSFFRAPQFATGILMKILMVYFYINFAVLFFGGAFLFYFLAEEENADPLKLFSRFFLFYVLADLVLKYFLQQLPAENIKPFLSLNITKKQITGYTFAKILISFFSWVFFLFMMPFSILLISNGYSTAGVISMFVMSSSMVFINTFINTLINKKDWLLYTVFVLIALIAALQYFNLWDVAAFSEKIFYAFYTNPVLAVIPVAVAGFLAYFTFRFIRENLYLDKGLEMKKAVGKTENIAFLNRFGSIGTFINNDIKLIRRSKAARGAFIGGLIFLLYGLLYFTGHTYSTSFMQIFLGIFITGGFNMVFGQRVPAWDSSYYPLMMTQNVPYKDYLKAKWAIFVFGIVISMVLAIGYAFISWEFYFTIFAAGLYNLGVNSYLTLLGGAYNKKPIDLNSASKGFTGGQNNFNIKMILISLPQLALPMAVFGILKYFAGMTPAVLSLGLLGLVGFLLRDRIFDMIVKIYKTEKHSTLAAFRQGT